MSSGYFEELREETVDFFEDFWQHLSKNKPEKPYKKKTLLVNGLVTSVRPAYLFAERVDNLLKIIFGLSIAVSALTATFLGFTGLSELLDTLIFTPVGRLIMFTIGISYLTIALWKLLHLTDRR